MSHVRFASAVVLGSALACAALPLARLPAQGASERTVEFTGLVLMNGFWNDNSVNNSDVPQFVVRDTAARRGGLGGTARQTRLGVFVTQPDVLGGVFLGEVDVDFFGGQLGNAGRTFPLVRLRRFVARVNWRRGEVLVGQEAPLITELNPRSLASIGVPGYVTAGNLWFWMPQVRASWEAGSTARIGLQAAVIAPMTERNQGTFATQPDSAELTNRPFLQGRVRLAWGDPGETSEIGVGAHQGWLVESDSTLASSQAVAVSARVRFRRVELLGEWYTGQAVAVLGGGGIGRNISAVTGEPLDDTGGWGQIVLRPTPLWEIGAGAGYDEPDQAQVDGSNPAERLRNLVYAVHALWRPAGPLVVGGEVRHIETKYGGATGTLTNTHVNLQAGFRF